LAGTTNVKTRSLVPSRAFGVRFYSFITVQSVTGWAIQAVAVRAESCARLESSSPRAILFAAISPHKMKNWKSILWTAGIAIIAVAVVYPLLRPTLQKIPLVGTYFA
jgi:hypothetical protein